MRANVGLGERKMWRIRSRMFSITGSISVAYAKAYVEISEESRRSSAGPAIRRPPPRDASLPRLDATADRRACRNKRLEHQRLGTRRQSSDIDDGYTPRRRTRMQRVGAGGGSGPPAAGRENQAEKMRRQV